MENFFYETRSFLHQIPELGFEEYKTSEFIRKFLENLNIPYKTIGTSTLAIFKGETNSFIGFRADIDGLPITEENCVPYKSTHLGKMHACGHDGHTTLLLYFAKWIKEQNLKLKKGIILIFQAAEEGKGGAKPISESLLFNSINFEGIFALHLFPGLEEGKIACCPGYFSFQNINIDLEIIGKGCHAAQPQKGIDSILISAKLIEAYQSIISRNIDPFEPVIFTIGSFKAGEVRNIIPEKVNILGTIRLLNISLIDFIKKRITDINEGFEKAFSVKINMNFKPFYPPVINSKELFQILKKIVPTQNLITDIRLSGSEDFSFYLNKNKGLLFLLGCKNIEKGFTNPLHSPKFDFDPKVLKFGFDIFKNVLLNFNSGGSL